MPEDELELLDDELELLEEELELLEEELELLDEELELLEDELLELDEDELPDELLAPPQAEIARSNAISSVFFMMHLVGFGRILFFC